MRMPEVFHEIVQYGLALGARDVSKLPGCWEAEIDEHWWVALNAHDHPIKCSQGATVPPYAAFVYFNGWPGGVIDAFGGSLCAGAIANEEALIAALREARRKVA